MSIAPKILAGFMESRGLVDWIPKLVLYDDSLKPEINMVHYTTWKHARDMFNPSPESSPILRMYNYEQSNDPDEGKIKPPGVEGGREEGRRNGAKESLKKWAKESLIGENHWNAGGEIERKYIWMFGFPSGPSGVVEDDLTYWRLYGNDGQGCSPEYTTIHKDVYEVALSE